MKRPYMNAKFVISAEKLSQCPDFKLPEFPLLGRSNVGKSSFINGLANNKKLARTSNTPGKTRLINFFDFSDKFMIADLPGYGYAKVSAEAQNKWQKYLEEYLLKREQITNLVQLIDARHEIQKNDFQMREWVLTYDLPIITVVTKIDCISKNKIQSAIAHVKREFGGEIFPFSAVDNRYNDKILSYFLQENL
ncbi:MAG: ribosome biogenesis GTP-binding protein YihA/YsxC [Candidatus Gastranaerophilaceae bacterium]|nr:YihA family ribosome biogenesis GTP-binding protein [bacterium]MEE0496804.1 ribosome biogenesis GTP-binding protein YihA/YsxC [Cyanobacteriota bacterium]CDE91637.1 probable GTP-binding protein EngB [Fusobacterium sp. CAG:815]DAA91317.1 MAG TPA: YihA family ribosome biogenesis GTP-binding protein [Candidatus Gastranaerophilales bacterium HUM_7]DAA91641.1 MAG TPA: YihA family ribosome biogenesis GTP-binding protein [Candidatus Gastranaerophilales bacterium HUM_6]DAB02994.1 MAG TPA: YihA famil